MADVDAAKAVGGFTLRTCPILEQLYEGWLKFRHSTGEILWDPRCIPLAPTTSIPIPPCSRRSNVSDFLEYRPSSVLPFVPRLLHLHVKPRNWFYGLHPVQARQGVLLQVLPHSVLGEVPSYFDHGRQLIS